MRQAVEAYCAAKDTATDLSPTFSFTFCTRSPEVQDSSALVRLGWLQCSQLCWKWLPLAAGTREVKTPVDVSTPTASPSEQLKPEDEEMREHPKSIATAVRIMRTRSAPSSTPRRALRSRPRRSAGASAATTPFD